MKRINNYVLNGALALLSTAGLVACSSSDDVTDAPVNPTYDGKSVKTQFAINVATPSNGKTRMSDVNTQNKDNYLGMTNVRLLTLANTPGNDIELTSVIPLADPNTLYTNQNSSHIYSDVNIPVGTSNFLFYSTRKDLGTDMENKFITGAIVSDMFTNNSPSYLSKNEIKFASEKILSGSNTVDTYKTDFETFLNSVIAVSNWSSTTNPTLQAAYKNLTTQFSDGQYAGSAFAIKKLMTDLYNAVNPISVSSTASDEDKNLANNIKTAITNSSNVVYFEVDAANSGTLKYGSNVAPSYSKFPCYNGLPEGSALLTFDNSSNKFTYDAAPQIGGGGSDKVKSHNLTYPLPIVYFDNTPARANNAEIDTWPETTSTWDADNTWTGWYDNVLATTRSIALKNNINYGVACLKTTFTCEGTTLEDNRKGVDPSLENQTITIPSEGFQVTGILIGGQPENVNWQFINAETNRDYVVYDKKLSDIKAGRDGASSAANYTLVFDNWTSASTGQEPVNVAIELVNTAADFYGVDGIVAYGQKFYLIGQLDPTNPATGSSITWPEYPDSYSGADDTLPKSYDGRYPVKAGLGNNRVFVQDFTTTANFTIKSLKNAYVTIPDLRASKLQLGLSVDLEWKTGLTYNVDL